MSNAIINYIILFIFGLGSILIILVLIYFIVKLYKHIFSEIIRISKIQKDVIIYMRNKKEINKYINEKELTVNSYSVNNRLTPEEKKKLLEDLR